MTTRRHLVGACFALVGLSAAACVDGTVGVTPPPTGERSLDEQVRASISGWGVVPILPVNAQDPALVDLGKSLFFDKILSGNRDVSCATCHSPLANSGDAQSLAVGTGAVLANGTRTLGTGRQFTPRNAPSLFNSALGSFYIFWDGRLSEQLGPGRFQTPTDLTLPNGLSGLLAAQAMVPVTNRIEMRGRGTATSPAPE
jgi:cytochrome c peroxidase